LLARKFINDEGGAALVEYVVLPPACGHLLIVGSQFWIGCFGVAWIGCFGVALFSVRSTLQTSNESPNL
jgi:hypothetical protein